MELVEDARRRLGGHPGLPQAAEADQRLGVIHDRLAAEVEVAGELDRLEAAAEVVIGIDPAPEVDADDAEVVVCDGAAMLVPGGEEPRERALVAVERLDVIALGTGDGGKILLDPSEQVRIARDPGRLAEEGARLAEPLVEEVDAPGRIECLRDQPVVARFTRHGFALGAQRPGRGGVLAPAAHHGEAPERLRGDPMVAGGVGRGDGRFVRAGGLLEIALPIVLAGDFQQPLGRRRSRGQRGLRVGLAIAERDYHATAYREKCLRLPVTVRPSRSSSEGR